MTNSPNISQNDLPYWMRQAQRRWDRGFVLMIVLALTAAWPFLLQPGLPRTNASENYVFMAADYSEALREGRFYPRWSPNALGGYGAPIPHYYPPGAPYSAALVQILFTNSAVDAVRIIYMLAFCIAAVSVYLLVKRHANAITGVVSAALYVYSPYLAHVTPHILGDLAGMIALSLAPALLWLADRLLSANRPADLLMVALATAALFLTQVYIAMAALTLVICLTVFHLLQFGRKVHWRLIFIALLLGICFAAFYWLPAVWEYNLVEWRSRLPLRIPYLTLADLLTPLRPIDLNALVPAPQVTIGLTGIMALALTLTSMVMIQRNLAFHILFFIMAVFFTAVGLFAIPDASWLTGIISLCLAIAGGGGVALRQHLPTIPQRLYPVVIMLVIFWLAQTTWLAPRWSETFGEISPIQQIRYEQQGAGIAVLPASAPVPATIPESLPFNRFLLSGYSSGSINKVSPLPSNPGIQLSLLGHHSHAERFQVRFDLPVRIELLTAYFPGWQAFGEDHVLNINRNPSSGLMSIDVPAMNGELTVILNSTPPRQAGWIISWSAALIGLGLTWVRFRQSPPPSDEPDTLTVEQTRLLSICVGGIIAALLLFATPASPFSLHARPGYGLDNAVSLRNATSSGLQALAYRINNIYFRPGDTIRLSLYWEALLPLTSDYKAQVYLRNIQQNTIWHRTDFYTPGDYPTNRWRRYQYIRDDYTIQLSGSIVPGTYEIMVEVFDCSVACGQQDRQNFFNSSGDIIGPSLGLPTRILIGS
jgi:hypothetical protein